MSKITIKRMNKFEDKGSLKAYVDIQIGSSLTIYGCKFMDGKNGEWVGTPQRQDPNSEKWYSIVYIDKGDLQDEILKAVQEHYYKETATASTPSDSEQEFS